MIALLLGEMNNPLPDAENGQRQHHESEAGLRSIHDGEQQRQGEHADQHARCREEARHRAGRRARLRPAPPGQHHGTIESRSPAEKIESW
jgi:hypothetical protein